MKWQPIETAHKDGSEFLGCTHKGVVQIIKCDKHRQMWIDRDGRESRREIKFWMPLPAPPSNAEITGSEKGPG